ncbi:MAG TPA: ABC transporter substrate-binding protein [Bacillota bacterium]|nr:ABC transporter substrate-binding protein [Bacillota bacterium]HPT86838.1 ABC transporter substrate-binding protein [Bacillota bacterium]
MKKTLLAFLMVVVFTTGLFTTSAAEVKEIRIAKQYGLAYLPLIVVEEKRLIEKNAKGANLGMVKTSWVTLGSGASANDALLSGSVDYISGGVAPFIILWDKSKGAVKALAALDHTPIYLNTINPEVKSIRDFTEKDRIAVPAVKVSIQAVILQMAAAQEFGNENFTKLDSLTVSLKHPDALVALLSGKSEVTAHFATPPFSFRELDNSKVRKIIDSYEILGGPHTMNVLSTTKKFYDNNPKLNKVVLQSIDEAIAWIKNNKREAAELYIKVSKSNESVSEILAQLNNPQIDYDSAPLRITKFSDFLYQIGSIKTKPANWKELFFPDIHHKKGS